MRTKVYSFKPKGKSYTVYGTKTYGGVRNYSNRSGNFGSSRRSGGVMSDFVSGALAKFIVHGLLGIKK